MTYTTALGTLWEQTQANWRALVHEYQGLQLGQRVYVEFESLRFRH